MNSNNINSRIRRGFNRLLEEIITGGSKEEIGLPVSLIKSDYQRELEERGWELMSNVDAENVLIDYTKDRNSLRFLRKHCKRFYPEKRIKLARAHDRYGKRIPSKKKIVGVYTRDRE